MNRRAPPRVVYLGGIGRSGSTLIERLLGELPGVSPVGEVVHMWRQGIVEGERCGCGEPFRKCGFWREVGAVAFGGWDNVDVRHFAELRAAVDRTRFIPLMAVRVMHPSRRRLVDEYVSYYLKVYSAIEQVSGCTVIVDSSKHPSLAFCLRRSAELDLRVIHVVRDSRAVAYSWSRKLMRPDTAMPTYMATPTPAASAWQWDYQNAAMLLLARSGTPTYRVRYEDFVMAPEATLARIAAFAGLSVAVNEIGFLGSDAGGRWADLTTSHTASGNPMRFTTGRIRIRPDEVWRTSMSASQRRTVTAITLPLLVHYRYSSRGRPELEASRVREWPSVGVILPAHDRPAQLRTALAAVLTQDYPGRLEAVVVYDRAEPDHSLADSEQVQVLVNARTPGLAGARNTGVLALDTDLIAFCDDDDEWLPGKLRAQVAALQDRPAAELASCGIVVEFGGRSSPRLVGRGEVTHDDLLRSRMVMVHSSTYLVRRGPLLDHIGLIDETIPESQSEDWDLALRAARRHPIVFVDRPLVRVTWGDASHFSQQWEARAESLLWMLRRHPGIAGSDAGAARVYGQLAFANACLGRRGDAWLWSRRAVRSNWHERRVPFALAVSVGLVSGDTVMRLLHSRGYGI